MPLIKGRTMKIKEIIIEWWLPVLFTAIIGAACFIAGFFI